MKSFERLVCLILMIVSPVSHLAAQEPAPGSAPAANKGSPACASPEFHQFDFWVGRWDVYGPPGRLVAHSVIEKLYNGCAVRENWMPLNLPGSDGGSLNAWQADDRHWHQSWVDAQGGFTYYSGGIEGNAMVLSGQGKSDDGRPALLRMIFTPLPDGSVRQVGTESFDKGKNWSRSYDFTYRAAQTGASAAKEPLKH